MAGRAVHLVVGSGDQDEPIGGRHSGPPDHRGRSVDLARWRCEQTVVDVGRGDDLLDHVGRGARRVAEHRLAGLIDDREHVGAEQLAQQIRRDDVQSQAPGQDSVDRARPIMGRHGEDHHRCLGGPADQWRADVGVSRQGGTEVLAVADLEARHRTGHLDRHGAVRVDPTDRGESQRQWTDPVDGRIHLSGVGVGERGRAGEDRELPELGLRQRRAERSGQHGRTFHLGAGRGPVLVVAAPERPRPEPGQQGGQRK